MRRIVFHGKYCVSLLRGMLKPGSGDNHSTMALRTEVVDGGGVTAQVRDQKHQSKPICQEGSRKAASLWEILLSSSSEEVHPGPASTPA